MNQLEKSALQSLNSTTNQDFQTLGVQGLQKVGLGAFLQPQAQVETFCCPVLRMSSTR